MAATPGLDGLGPISQQDLLTLLCGQFLGSGVTRNVYTCPIDDALVVKFETDTQRFQNQREWSVWDAVKDNTAVARWFAPCRQISYAGLWLLQARTRPVTLDELRRELPKVPAFFSDLKSANWGRLGKRIVCHDYGTALTTEHGLTTRMRKAEWWEL